MRAIPTINMDWTVRNFGQLIVLVMLIALAWRGAGWAWYFAAPSPTPGVPDLRGAVSVANVVRFPWFGAAPPSAVAAPISNIRLIGLFAGGKRPTALLVVGNQNPIAASAGESPAPGLQLVSIAQDHVIIQRNGISEKILLAGSTKPIQQADQDKETEPE